MCLGWRIDADKHHIRLLYSRNDIRREDEIWLAAFDLNGFSTVRQGHGRVNSAVPGGPNNLQKTVLMDGEVT